MTKAYRIIRQSPTDLDESGETTPSLQFDYRHKGGASPWPERHRFSGVKFGPALIKAAWKSGLVVVAYVDGFPNPVAVTETRWSPGVKVFQVKCQEGWRIPSRIKTVTSVEGLKSTGEYVEPTTS